MVHCEEFLEHTLALCEEFDFLWQLRRQNDCSQPSLSWAGANSDTVGEAHPLTLSHRENNKQELLSLIGLLSNGVSVVKPEKNLSLKSD